MVLPLQMSLNWLNHMCTQGPSKFLGGCCLMLFATIVKPVKSAKKVLMFMASRQPAWKSVCRGGWQGLNGKRLDSL